WVVVIEVSAQRLTRPVVHLIRLVQGHLAAMFADGLDHAVVDVTLASPPLPSGCSAYRPLVENNGDARGPANEIERVDFVSLPDGALVFHAVSFLSGLVCGAHAITASGIGGQSISGIDMYAAAIASCGYARRTTMSVRKL